MLSPSCVRNDDGLVELRGGSGPDELAAVGGHGTDVIFEIIVRRRQFHFVNRPGDGAGRDRLPIAFAHRTQVGHDGFHRLFVQGDDFQSQHLAARDNTSHRGNDEARLALILAWSKNSCSLPVVEFKQPAQALTGADFTRRLTDPVRWRWKQNHIRLPLMVSFVVKMVSIMGKHMLEGGISEQNHFRQALLFHRAIPSLQVRGQIWTSRGQHQRFDP